MHFNSAKLTVLLSLTLVLLLTPLYKVYAEENSTSARATTLPKLELRKANLEAQKARFEGQIALMREKIASREAQFKLRVDKFTDRLKSEIAQKVNKNLNMINQNQTASMNKNLDKMSSILDRLVIKVGGTASTSAQVVSAQSAIDSSRTIVTNQALKDYTISVSTESAIRKDSQAMREKLHTDLKTTRDSVQAAKKAVLTALRNLLGEKEATKSATQSGLPVN